MSENNRRRLRLSVSGETAARMEEVAMIKARQLFGSEANLRIVPDWVAGTTNDDEFHTTMTVEWIDE
ncbi:hypothetical protein AB0G15_05710 [Streptosporangium sp. NPDC023825]|uniref:hypothetical protein n=1 Tax=Streptosporangium sp. NPDC023825 TaxID=3154909 RepID=UPI00343E486D